MLLAFAGGISACCFICREYVLWECVLFSLSVSVGCGLGGGQAGTHEQWIEPFQRQIKVSCRPVASGLQGCSSLHFVQFNVNVAQLRANPIQSSYAGTTLETCL